MSTKPILFNTEMVRAIQNGTKTVTRRVIKPTPYKVCFGGVLKYSEIVGKKVLVTANRWEELEMIVPPYQPGEILYVRETFCGFRLPGGKVAYHYKASEPNGNRTPTGPEPDDEWDVVPWRPSIHMPRKAARIFLRVTNVRVERLQEMADEDLVRDFGFCWEAIQAVGRDALAKPFWDSTIKPADRALYGWAANPWVWAIEFERCEKPEGETI